MDTKTIDQRIREKAREELQAKLDAAQKQFEKETFNGSGGGARTTVKRPGSDANYWASELMNEVTKALFVHQVARCEENAIAAFLARVDSLSDEVAELRGSISE